MRKMGLEPTRCNHHKILSLARLPVPTLPHILFRENFRSSQRLKVYQTKNRKSILFLKFFYFIFFNFSVDTYRELRYTYSCVKQTRIYIECRSGGIGRRAGFRCLWSQDRVGSSPISCIFYVQKQQDQKDINHIMLTRK